MMLTCPRAAVRALRAAVLLSVAACCTIAPGAAASTLETVRQRGYVACGVADGSPGFSELDAEGRWIGLDVEFCAALAAGVLGDKGKVRYMPLSNSDRFRALQQGEVDVLARTTTWTLSRESELGLRFAGVLFYDGQGFLARRDAGISDVLELSGASVCVLPGAPASQGLDDYLHTHGIQVERVTAATWPELLAAYADERCTVLTGDVSSLALARNGMARQDEHQILQDLITKEPLGPVVRQGDEGWYSIVRWTMMALIAAEELDVTSANVEAARDAPANVEVRRLLGLDGDLGATLGVSRTWVYDMVRQVGNYGEIFDRGVGSKSRLRLQRGLNNLWSKGGLMFAAPLR